MNLRPLLALSLGLVALAALPAQEAPAPAAAPATDTASPGSPTADLKQLVAQIREKLKTAKPDAASFAPEIAAFDALVEKYRGRKTEDVAQISNAQAMFYGEVLRDLDQMKARLAQVKADFPRTKTGASACRTLSSLERTAAAQKTSAALVGQPAPALHFAWSTRDGLKTLADLRGKVVVLDFWATWCGPCVASFPQVRELTAHYQGMDVVVVGVTSIQGYVTGLGPRPIDTKGQPQKEFSLLADFLKAKDMTWTVAVSDEDVFNPDYGITGIPHLVIVAPDGTIRHRGLHPAMPHAEKVGMIDALLKEFKLPVLASAPNR